MPISHRAAGDVDVISLSGSFDASEAPAAREEFRRICEKGSGKILIDLAQVQFIDSSGLSVLVSTLKNARNKGGDLALISLTPSVRSIIELTRLHRILDICDSEETALKKLGQK